MATLKIGITGGIGSGKSVVSRLLEVMGVPVYISDTEAKRLTASDIRIREGLVALLGEEVYKGGTLDKRLLADYLFASPDHAARVNAVIHPQVKADFRRWVSERSALPLVGMESAILVEAGFAPEVDCVVMVHAPAEVRIGRAMKRDSARRDEIERRIRSQMDDEEKCRTADFVIRNDGETPLIPQVLCLITSLSKNIDYLCSPKKK